MQASAAIQEQEGVTKTNEGELPRGAGQHILFVEDEEPLLKLGQRMLERLGYRVTALANPLPALDQIKAAPAKFALLITDLTMPGMTGIEFATQINHLDPALPIIVITGDTSVIDAEELKAIGVREIVAKPFAVRTLAEAIQKSLQR